jgi:hypothetical protein
MQSISTIGLDIAKSVFQVHGVDAAGQVIIRRQLKRRFVLSFFEKLPPCLVGIEACASSHYWSRELQALGHTVRLMPPAYVKPYVKRQKNDSTDAEAICEAVTRPNMRFVPTKTIEQQSCLMLHRVRHLFIRQQTAVINSIRAYLAEFGIVAPVGRRGVVLPGSIKRNEQATGCDPWRRSSTGNGASRERCRCQDLPIGAGLLGLGRARAEAELEWGQGQAWPDQQARRSLFTQPIHSGRTRRDPLCQDPWHKPSALAHCVVGTAPYQGRSHRTRQ